MSMDLATFNSKISGVCLNFAYGATRGTQLTAIATALNTDTTTHSHAIEAPPVALRIGPDKTPFTNEILFFVHQGKDGNLPNATMKTAVTNLAAAPPNPIRGM